MSVETTANLWLIQNVVITTTLIFTRLIFQDSSKKTVFGARLKDFSASLDSSLLICDFGCSNI